MQIVVEEKVYAADNQDHEEDGSEENLFVHQLYLSVFNSLRSQQGGGSYLGIIFHFGREFNQAKEVDRKVLFNLQTPRLLPVEGDRIAFCRQWNQAIEAIMIQGGWNMSKRPIFYPENPDRRIIEKRIRTGEIAQADLKDYLQSLPDVSYNAEDITVTLDEKK